jgi:predicted outer membrane repeat protein
MAWCMYCASTATLLPYNSQCVFLNNTSSSQGGAVTAGSSSDNASIVNMTACTFSNNRATDSGGALYLSGTAYIHKTVFSNNAAQGSGGAIDASQAALTVSSTVFQSNIASASGGAVYTEKPLIASDTAFTSNSAQSGNGGAVYHFSSANFDKCSFTENQAGQYGGAINAQSGSSLVMTRSLLNDNTASYVGGAIFTNAPDNEILIADTVVFSNNTASCCYANNKVISNGTSCVNVAGGIGDGSEECCAKQFYSDGEHCQSCTNELTCAGIVGANTSTVVLPTKLWRASTLSTKTYSCWNADACVGGAAVRSVDDYCAAGYKGPCK